MANDKPWSDKEKKFRWSLRLYGAGVSAALAVLGTFISGEVPSSMLVSYGAVSAAMTGGLGALAGYYAARKFDTSSNVSGNPVVWRARYFFIPAAAAVALSLAGSLSGFLPPNGFLIDGVIALSTGYLISSDYVLV